MLMEILWFLAGGNRLGTLDKYVHRSLKLPTTCPVKKKRSVFQTKLRAAPLAPNYQIPPLISKQPTGNKEQVSAGKQPVVAESVHKNKPQVGIPLFAGAFASMKQLVLFSEGGSILSFRCFCVS